MFWALFGEFSCAIGICLRPSFLSNGKGHFGPIKRNYQTGQSGPPSWLVPNIPVWTNQNGPFHLMYQPQFPEFWIEWKAPLNSRGGSLEKLLGGGEVIELGLRLELSISFHDFFLSKCRAWIFFLYFKNNSDNWQEYFFLDYSAWLAKFFTQFSRSWIFFGIFWYLS